MAWASISDLALLSDCRSGALVDRAGRVLWWCPERFDRSAWFAGLVGTRGGEWSLSPAGTREVRRSYLEDSLILRTTFVTVTGVVELTEGLLFAPGARGHEIGIQSPRALARSLVCLDGAVSIDHRFEPRSSYGLTAPRFERDGSMIHAHEAGARLSLVGADDLQGSARGLESVVDLRAGERRDLVCSFSEGGSAAPRDAKVALDDTHQGWRSWTSAHERPEGPYGAEIALAARVLQGLTHQETGAILAAPTTSLPEVMGGEANWDYRYAWLRDSSLVVHALRRATCADEATRYLTWMARVAHDGNREGETQAVFGLDGARLLHESTLDHLDGFAGSRPVRVGNAAFQQRQLDTYGHVLEAAATDGDGASLEPAVQRFLCQTASRAGRTWREPDHGVWERREEPLHYTASKLQCWVALDRALTLESHLGDGADPSSWRAERTALRDWLESVWDARRGVFPAVAEGDEVDASALLFILSGFVEPNDPRAHAIVDGVEQELGHGGLLRRWTTSEDGAFLVCSFWLAQALATIGELERAGEVLERASACANDLGLLPEEIDPATGAALGNVPLAISHAGLVRAASAIEEARQPEFRTRQAVS